MRLCKNGNWVHVVVDDYFPCSPEGGPVYSRGEGDELWVLLLEKAFAKVSLPPPPPPLCCRCF